MNLKFIFDYNGVIYMKRKRGGPNKPIFCVLNGCKGACHDLGQNYISVFNVYNVKGRYFKCSTKT